MLWSSIKMNNREITEISYECRKSHTWLINNVSCFFSLSTTLLLLEDISKLTFSTHCWVSVFQQQSRGRKKRARAMQGEALLSSPGPSWVWSQLFSVKTSVPKGRQCHLLEPVLLRNQCLWGETATSACRCLIPKRESFSEQGAMKSILLVKIHKSCACILPTVHDNSGYINPHSRPYKFLHVLTH